MQIRAKQGCGCSPAAKFIFPCSGSSDVGELTDRVSRELTRQGTGRMFCLAGIGGNISGIVESTKAASKVLVIDGCNLDCAKKTMERGGFQKFEYIRLSDMGLEKGKSPVSSENMVLIMNKAKEALAC